MTASSSKGDWLSARERLSELGSESAGLRDAMLDDCVDGDGDGAVKQAAGREEEETGMTLSRRRAEECGQFELDSEVGDLADSSGAVMAGISDSRLPKGVVLYALSC